MHTITLLRHAKSSWAAATAGGAMLSDKARPLAPRGLRDAPRMAAWLAERGLRADLVLCSAAVRTTETWELVKDHLLAPGGRVEVRDDLYLAAAEDIVDILRTVADRYPRVLVIGHDPGMHDLARLLTGSGEAELRRLLAQKFPTAAAAVIDLPIDRWRALGAGTGTLRHFMAPKRLPERGG